MTTFTQMSNVLFILTDQWPAWAFSFQGADIPTPNIDQLASEGTVFTNAFTPARFALLLVVVCSPHVGNIKTGEQGP